MASIETRIAQGVGRITLARPDQGNAIDMDLAERFTEAADAMARDPAVRCVLIAGTGRYFCVGGDVGAFAAAGDRADSFLHGLAGALHRGLVILADMPKPLVVAVNGPAAGAGLSLALVGDIVIAGRSAHFTSAYSAIGLTPDGGLSWRLPRIVGLRRAQEMMLTNRRVGAEEAERIGLVTRIVDDEAVAREAEAAAAALAAGPTAALGGIRALLDASDGATLADQLAREADRIAVAGIAPEGREGVAAFLERRKPDFTPRGAG